MNHSLVSNHLAVTINRLGAELSSIRDTNGLEYLWQANPKIWPRHAPVLFPIVGRLKQNRFAYCGKEYNLSQHGFARDKGFELVELSPSNCVFELNPDEQTKINYPFSFILRISYRLEGKKLTTHYQVVNSAEEPMYFNIGAHPGFNCPLLPGEKFEDYYLEFETERLSQTALKEGLRTNSQLPLPLRDKKLSLSSDLFDNDALVFENNQINRIGLHSSVSGHKVVLECKDWPYFGIWTKPGCRDFICLEPWHGVTDREASSGLLTEKEGIIKLDPGKEFNCEFSISIG